MTSSQATQDAAQSRARHRAEELGGATIRALAGDTRLHLRGRRLWRGAQPLPRFGLHLEPADDGDEHFASLRGAADGMALRLLHSDPAWHRANAPSDPAGRWVFELLEQLRCESLASLAGVRANLRQRFDAWSLAFHRAGPTGTVDGLLLYTLAQSARSRLFAEPLTEATEDLVESTRVAILPAIGTALAALRRHRDDQRAFAPHALAIARWTSERLARMAEELGRAGVDRDEAAPRAGIALQTDFDGDDDEGGLPVAGGGRRAEEDGPAGYRVFSTAYDIELRAGAGIRRALLDEYRAQIDRRLAKSGINSARLARVIRSQVAQPARDGFTDGEEEGLIDARRLAQLVASPAERRLFRLERHPPRVDCAVALLIDCSGSMREGIEALAVLIDALARAFETAGTACEVLGFTTGAWNGGRALRDWRRSGRPEAPGRLAERCHLVFKDADTPWRRARRDIAALLKTDRFREGLDGEAVDWACERLAARSAQRRVLFVLSDGSPSESATAAANPAGYLDRHLREVVARRAAQGTVEVVGIGVGLDLGTFYDRSVALDPRSGLGNAQALEILRALRRR